MQAAACEPDPLNGVCVTPTTYAVSGTSVTVQRTPKTGNTLRSIAKGANVGVICQVTNGGTAAAYPWPTQDAWVVDGHGYYEGECVSFAAWAVRTDGRAHTKLPDFLANANQWTGAYVDATPHVGDVA